MSLFAMFEKLENVMYDMFFGMIRQNSYGIVKEFVDLFGDDVVTALDEEGFPINVETKNFFLKLKNGINISGKMYTEEKAVICSNLLINEFSNYDFKRSYYEKNLKEKLLEQISLFNVVILIDVSFFGKGIVGTKLFSSRKYLLKIAKKMNAYSSSYTDEILHPSGKILIGKFQNGSLFSHFKEYKVIALNDITRN